MWGGGRRVDFPSFPFRSFVFAASMNVHMWVGGGMGPSIHPGTQQAFSPQASTKSSRDVDALAQLLDFSSQARCSSSTGSVPAVMGQDFFPAPHCSAATVAGPVMAVAPVLVPSTWV